MFALKYGFDILQGMGLKSQLIRAGNANMFLSPLFREAFVNTIGGVREGSLHRCLPDRPL